MRVSIYPLLFLLLSACNSAEKQQDMFTENYQSEEVSPEINSGVIVSTINYKFDGCFGSGSRRLEVIQSNDKKRALLTDDDGTTYKTNLDSAKLRAYNNFIDQLKNTKFGFGCTTTAYYKVIIGKDSIEREDGGCSWEGFQTLRNALFNQ